MPTLSKSPPNKRVNFLFCLTNTYEYKLIFLKYPYMHSKVNIVVKCRKSLENGAPSKAVPSHKNHEVESQVQDRKTLRIQLCRWRRHEGEAQRISLNMTSLSDWLQKQNYNLKWYKLLWSLPPNCNCLNKNLENISRPKDVIFKS